MGEPRAGGGGRSVSASWSSPSVSCSTVWDRAVNVSPLSRSLMSVDRYFSDEPDNSSPIPIALPGPTSPSPWSGIPTGVGPTPRRLLLRRGPVGAADSVCCWSGCGCSLLVLGVPFDRFVTTGQTVGGGECPAHAMERKVLPLPGASSVVPADPTVVAQFNRLEGVVNEQSSLLAGSPAVPSPCKC